MNDSDDIYNESMTSSISRAEFDKPTMSSPVGSPSSLFFIAESQEERLLQSDISDTSKLYCDKNFNLRSSKDLIGKTSHHVDIMNKSLPLEISGFRRYQSMPHGQRTTGSPTKSLNEMRGRTASDDSSPTKLSNEWRNRALSDNSHEVSNKDHSDSAFHSKPDQFLFEMGDNSESDKKGIGVMEGGMIIPEICVPDSETIESADFDITNMKLDGNNSSSKEEGFVEGTFPNVDEPSGNTETIVLDNQPKSIQKNPLLIRENKTSSVTSSDSSKSSKNRADSFNTDSTTSGVSSCESVPHTGASTDVISLSPIASTASLNSMGVHTHSSHAQDTKEIIHPSSIRRKSLNLNRIPSVRKKQTSPAYGMLSSSRLSEGWTPESAIMYTTSRDAHGYATWRSIKRQRTISSDLESDLGISNLYDEEGTIVSLSRQSSMESKINLDVFGSSVRLG